MPRLRKEGNPVFGSSPRASRFPARRACRLPAIGWRGRICYTKRNRFSRRARTMATATSGDLPKTMRAVVCCGPEDYRLQEMPVPQAGPDEVVVKIDAAGVCASDVKCYTGAPLFWGDAN